MTSPTIFLCGCPLNTGNNGVSALAISVIQNLMQVKPACKILIQHNTAMPREINLSIGGQIICLETVFFHASTKFLEYKGLKFANMVSLFACYAPTFIRKAISNQIPLFSAIEKADIVLDISGGDSFTSIYGERVFESITTIKKIAIRMGKPLYLLPQSYGPFESVKQRAATREILAESKLVSCRDMGGREYLLESFPFTNNQKFTNCPDLAFSMDPDCSKNHIVDEHFGQCDPENLRIIGLNISGLLYANKINFGFQSDYLELLDLIIKWIIDELEAKVLLVPHVVSTGKTRKSILEYTDTYAINKVVDNLDEVAKNQILVLPETQDPRLIKGMIGECEYFIGSRMHACIAALSQSIPTTCLAYSDKFSGVMELAGFENCVVDMRNMSLGEIMKIVKYNYKSADYDIAELEEVNILVRELISKNFADYFKSI